MAGPESINAVRASADAAEWPAQRKPLGYLALLAAILLAGGAVALLALTTQSLGPTAFWGLVGAIALLVLATLAGLLAFATLSIRYRVEPGLLVVHWMGGEEIVPLAAVDAVWSGERIGERLPAGRLRLPGLNVGEARIRGLGSVRVVATSDRGADLSLIATGDSILAISPPEPAAFRRELISRIELDEPAAPGRTSRAGLLPYLRAFADPVGLPLVVAAVVGVLAVLGLVLYRMPDLPEQLPLNFDTFGRPDGFGPREELLRLPVIGALVLLFDLAAGVLLYSRERAAARLLWAGAAIVPPVLLVAVLRIMQ